MKKMMLSHYLKITSRNHLKNRGRTIVNILVLAIGFMAFIFGGYWWYWENHFDTFHPQNDRLYAIVTYGMVQDQYGKEAALNQLHKDDCAFFCENIPEIEAVTVVLDAHRSVVSEGIRKSYVELYADQTFFELFHHKFLEGGYEHAPYNGSNIILTRKMASRFFGDKPATGEIITLGEGFRGRKVVYTVAGVIDDYPTNSEFVFDYIILGENNYNSMGRGGTYVRLNKKADLSQVRQKIASHKSIARQRYSNPQAWSFRLLSMPELRQEANPALHNRFRNVKIMALAGLVAFLSALMNLLVLFIGNQEKKQRDFVTRISLGSSKKGITFKMYTELLLPLIIGLSLAISGTILLFPYYRDLTGLEGSGVFEGYMTLMDRLPFIQMVVWIAVLSLISYAVVSYFPVFLIRKNYYRSITRKGVGHFTPGALRRSLIILQVLIGSFFFISALTMYKQLYFLKNADKGLNVDHILEINLGLETAYEMKDCASGIKSELLMGPHVKDVTRTCDRILAESGMYYVNFVGAVEIEGRDMQVFEETEESDPIFYIEENFFDFFGIKLKSGEFLSSHSPYDYVVNEVVETALGIPELVNRRVNDFRDKPAKIAGIVKNFHYASMQYPIGKIFFYLMSCGEWDGNHFRYIYVKYDPAFRPEVLDYVKGVIARYDKGEVEKNSQITELSEVMKEFNRADELVFTLFAILSAICILISLSGIYSLVALSVEQRRKEIAIRKVNGSSFRDLLFLFFREYFIMGLIGDLIAILLGYYVMQWWLDTYTFHIRLNGWIFLAVLIITCLLVWLTIFIVVRKTLKANPAEALKEE